MAEVNVYIDGFNLYYRAVKNTPYKWLDLLKLSQMLLPSHQINRIRYFTALVQQRPDDPQVQRRQLTYIRALETIANLSVHRGQFRTRHITRPLVTPIPGIGRSVEVIDTEEKGSDVNLATYLLLDAFEGDYEQAVVISNDSDFVLPIKLVSEQLKLPVGVVNPNVGNHRSTPHELTDAATFTRRLRLNALRDCQFPDVLTDAQGVITKPASW